MSVYTILEADVNVQAITTSIHKGQAPQGTTAPYIVIDDFLTLPQNNLSERVSLDNNLINIDCYGVDQQQSISLYEACRTALELSVQLLGVNIKGIRDPDLDIFRTQFDVSEWASR